MAESCLGVSRKKGGTIRACSVPMRDTLNRKAFLVSEVEQFQMVGFVLFLFS